MLEEMSPNQRIRYAFTLFVFAGAFAVIDIPLIIVMSFVNYFLAPLLRHRFGTNRNLAGT
jgi:hypothetical protein